MLQISAQDGIEDHFIRNALKALIADVADRFQKPAPT
jgi:hypothetical protein